MGSSVHCRTWTSQATLRDLIQIKRRSRTTGHSQVKPAQLARLPKKGFTNATSEPQGRLPKLEGGSRPVLSVLSNSSDYLPYAVVASALLALAQPASFAWFTPSLYAPGLGFLMFAVGVNLQLKAFAKVFKSPKLLLLGTLGQWVVKPLLGILLASTLVPMLRLPAEVATGLVLVSCVSGAQLSNYATFLVHPEQAALSIVLTALSTAAGVVVTPLLVFLLLGQRIPVDVTGMAASILQIVILPVSIGCNPLVSAACSTKRCKWQNGVLSVARLSAVKIVTGHHAFVMKETSRVYCTAVFSTALHMFPGLLCSTLLPGSVKKLRPVLAPMSLLDTCACVGASLSSNAAAARSKLGVAVLLPVLVFHSLAFVIGYWMARAALPSPDNVPVARCISLETGMQSSLLGLLLASRFLQDPLICLPCGISVIAMTLSGFALVLMWKRQDLHTSLQDS